MIPHPVVWTIAGSDSGGGAGIQSDLATFHDFKVHGCTVITALTAQNTRSVSDILPTGEKQLIAQLDALKQDLTPASIKLGMLYDSSMIACVASHIQDSSAPIIADPVMVSTSGFSLSSPDFIQQYLKRILPLATLVTPNVYEASALTGIDIQSFEDIEKAAALLIDHGAQSVLIKGGDLNHPTLSSDYYSDQKQSWWINQQRVNSPHTHGTGCTLSSAIAASIAQGWSLADAIVLAKAYVHAGITHPIRVGSGHQPIGHVDVTALKNHFPWITSSPSSLQDPFKAIATPIGRYPVVDNVHNLEALCSKGVRFIQLRIKNKEEATESIFHKAHEITHAYNVTLVVNDYVNIAKRINAPALHLGQEDINEAPLNTLDRESIILGITAHNLFELARAYAYHPSYLTMGPIFETKSKNLDYALVGMEKLEFIASLCPLPLVAVGGITLERTQEVLNMNCSGVAFIKASQQLMQEGRYDRHLSLPDFDLSMQKRLMKAKIVCVGVGGLGAGFLPYLASAGIGQITLIDDDTVSYSNLQRQILFREQDLGQSKTASAARYVSQLNSQVNVTPKNVLLNKENVIELLRDHDLIIDGTDNFYTHFLINDAARTLNTPLVAAAVSQEKGQLFHFSSTSGCYRCAIPDGYEAPSCQDSGILGTVAGMLGVMQATIALQILRGDVMPSFCRTVDGQTGMSKTLMIKPDSQCICRAYSASTPTISST